MIQVASRGWCESCEGFARRANVVLWRGSQRCDADWLGEIAKQASDALQRARSGDVRVETRLGALAR